MNTGDILTSPSCSFQNEELQFEQSLRPMSLDDFIGQSALKEKLDLFIRAAKSRNEALDHCLFHGPPGLGKTSLANIMANELGSRIIVTSGPALEKSGDLAAILTNLAEKNVLFIDEIHRLSRVVEETLYPAMEDFELNVVIGQGPGARAIKIPLPRFTLIGATTRAGLLTSPLRDRFGFSARLDHYNTGDLALIARRSAGILNVAIDTEGSLEIASRSRGTPRISNRLLRRVRDYAQVKADGFINREIADKALNLLEVDQKGFDEMDRRILTTIIEKFGGGPVGLTTLASCVGEEPDTIEDIYESFLIQGGYIAKTPRGRVVTHLAYEHLGIRPGLW
ncbi:MAG: Holliday junction branch migration DNA helicase RuvB [Oligoflexia bacterium]|nr:Holliday junction branch migration DNA helicase RuvB [Oligoflexia bacterium]